MKRLLRAGAAAVVLAALAFWLFAGRNTGWTKTSVPMVKQDPVTEIEYREYEERLVPGVDFLGAAVLAAALMLGLSFLPFGRKQ